MRLILSILIAMTLSSSAFGLSKVQPDYLCYGDNGLQYNFYSTFFNEIQVFDVWGSDKGMFDGIDFQVQNLKSNPMQIRVSVIDEDGEIVASFKRFENQQMATGTINDYINSPGEEVTINCPVNFDFQ